MEQSNVIDDSFLEEMQRLISDHVWRLKKTKHNVSIYSRTLPRYHEKLKAYKLEAEIKCPADQIVTLLHDQMTQRHGEWDDTYVEGRVIEKIDDNNNIQYWRFSPGLFLTDRDFVVRRRKFTSEDGTVYLVDKSIERNDMPPIKGIIRCDLPMIVRVIRPLADDRVKYIHMNLTDIKGWIPKWLVNISNPEISLKEVENIRRICERT